MCNFDVLKHASTCTVDNLLSFRSFTWFTSTRIPGSSWPRAMRSAQHKATFTRTPRGSIHKQQCNESLYRKTGRLHVEGEIFVTRNRLDEGVFSFHPGKWSLNWQQSGFYGFGFGFGNSLSITVADWIERSHLTVEPRSKKTLPVTEVFRNQIHFRDKVAMEADIDREATGTSICFCSVTSMQFWKEREPIPFLEKSRLVRDARREELK